jgi:hypothetical protein
VEAVGMPPRESTKFNIVSCCKGDVVRPTKGDNEHGVE